MIYWRRPLTRLELALYAAVVGLLLAIFADISLYYMETAERTAMEGTVLNVNTGFRNRKLVQMFRGDRDSGAEVGSPFQLAGVVPHNYSGDRSSGAAMHPGERGIWMLDRATGEVLYLPRFTRRLRTEDPARAIRFRVVEAAPNGFKVLVPSQPYAWD